MRIEDTLVYLLAVATGIVLFLGLARALDGPRRRPPKGRASPPPRARRRRSGSPEPLLIRPSRRPSPRAAPEPPVPEAPPVEAGQGTSEPTTSKRLEGKDLKVETERSPDLLDRAVELYERGQHSEALATAQDGLRAEAAYGSAGDDSASAVPARTAALWSLVALSRQALGDGAGARSAFESAAAPRASAAPLGDRIGRHLLAAGETASEGSDQRVLALDLAVQWLLAELGARGGDGDLAALLERARDQLGAAIGERAAALIARREYALAHRLVEEALGSRAVPASRRDALVDLFWTCVTGEIGRLTGQALEPAQAAGDALALLQHAEAVAGAVAPEALSADRREDLNRRLWWGYTKLGLQRVETGDFEGALEPLYRALALGEVDPERETETRQALGRALDGAAERSGEAIARLLEAGDRAAAEGRGRALSEALDWALERGLSQEDLAGALARRQDIMLRIAGGAGA